MIIYTVYVSDYSYHASVILLIAQENFELNTEYAFTAILTTSIIKIGDKYKESKNIYKFFSQIYPQNTLVNSYT